jgi:lipopolysaccharide transport system permease protein
MRTGSSWLATRHVEAAANLPGDGQDLPTRVYTPESPVPHPLTLVRQALRELGVARGLAWRLAIRDISAQYRQTFLGYLWTLLPAVMMTLVWVVLNKASVVHITTGTVPYAVFALTGTIFWSLFLDGLNSPLNQLAGNRAMIIRVQFPPEALILSGILQVAFSFVIKFALLLVVIFALSAPLQWTATLVVIPATAFVAFGVVVGVLLAPLGALYKDVQQGLLAIVMPLMFLTPVIYPPPSTGTLATLMRYNPLTPLFGMTRYLMFGTGSAPITGFAIVFGGTLVVGILGWLLFRLVMPVLVERMDA